MTAEASQQALREHVERLLERDVAQDPERVHELLTCVTLTPAQGESGPEQAAQQVAQVELLAMVVEHASVQAGLRADALPEALREHLWRALPEAMALVGLRPVGTLAQLAAELARRCDAERRKLELIHARASRATPERAHAILTAYLALRPAPLYAALLRQRLPEPMALAQADVARGDFLAALRQQRGLLHALRAQSAAWSGPDERVEDELGRELSLELGRADQALRAGFEQRLRLGLLSEEEDVVVVSAAMAAWWGQAELTSLVLERGQQRAALVAPLWAMASVLDEAMTRHHLSMILAEQSWGNPEDPELALGQTRVMMLLVARALLPKLGSPLPPLMEQALGPLAQTPQARQALRQALALRAAWPRAAAQGHSGRSSGSG